MQSIDEASKAIGHSSTFPSVIGFGSWQNPRKNTFSIARDPGCVVEYIEINNRWTHPYYITFESRSRDFIDGCFKECAIAAPRQGRERQPHRPRARPQAQSEEDGNRREQDASETMIGRRRMREKMHIHTA